MFRGNATFKTIHLKFNRIIIEQIKSGLTSLVLFLCDFLKGIFAFVLFNSHHLQVDCSARWETPPPRKANRLDGNQLLSKAKNVYGKGLCVDCPFIIG